MASRDVAAVMPGVSHASRLPPVLQASQRSASSITSNGPNAAALQSSTAPSATVKSPVSPHPSTSSFALSISDSISEGSRRRQKLLTSVRSTNGSPSAISVGPIYQKKAYTLTKWDKGNPLVKYLKDVARQNATQPLPEPKVRDLNKEAVLACAPYTESFNMLLRSTERGNRDLVVMVLDRMEADRIPMDTNTYNMMLQIIADTDYGLAMHTYELFKRDAEREEASVQPNLTTLDYMLRACERNGRYDTGFRIYRQLKELVDIKPDRELYNTLLRFCASISDEAQAAFLVEEMREDGMSLDVHSYNILMHVFADSPYEVILQTFEEMVHSGISPNLQSYNSLIKACQRMWDYDRAFQFFEEMKKDSIVPNVVTYNLLLVLCLERLDFVFGIGIHCDVRRTQEQMVKGQKAVAELATTLFSEMEEIEMWPNTYTYNALLGVLGRCQDHRVFAVFEQMKADHRIEEEARMGDNPSSDWMADPATACWVTENISTRGIPKLLPPVQLKNSIFLESVTGPARIASRSTRPNLDTYRTMIDAALRNKMAEKAFELFDEFKGIHKLPTIEMYIMMLDVCSLSSDLLPKAQKLMEEALQCHISVDIEVYNALLNAYATGANPELFKIFANLGGPDVTDVDHPVFPHSASAPKEGCGSTAVNNALGDPTQGNSLLRPTRDTYNVLLRGCFNMKDTKRAILLYRSMMLPDAPVKPDAVTYAILMDVCSVDNDLETASDLILQMKQRDVPATVATYCRLLNTYRLARDAGIVTVFRDLCTHGPYPNLEGHYILMSYYLEQQDSQIFELFEQMKNNSTLDLSLEGFNVILEMCAVMHLPKRAQKYFDELKMRGMMPNVATFNAMLHVQAPTGTDPLEKLLKEMEQLAVSPDQTTLAILMKHKTGRQVLARVPESQLVHPDKSVKVFNL